MLSQQVLQKWEKLQYQIANFFNQAQIIERIYQLQEQINEYDKQYKHSLPVLQKKKKPLYQQLTQERAKLEVLQSKEKGIREKRMTTLEAEKTKLENKLVKIKDLIQEQRWNSLKQMVKEGGI